VNSSKTEGINKNQNLMDQRQDEKQTQLVTDLVSHHLPFIGGSSSYTGPTGDLTGATSLRFHLAELTQPGDADLATGRTIGHQMPKSGAIPSALFTPPVAEDTQTSIEI
jgi:hypothetical protein